VLAQPGEPVVELATEAVHLDRIAGQRLLTPGERDRAQQRHQRGRRCQHHGAAERVLQQTRVAGQRRVQERIGRQEQHHELGRGVEAGPVALAAERVDVRPQRPRVLVELAVPDPLVARLCGTQVRVQRRLRVHHDVPAAVELHHQVGALPAVVGADRDLLGEVAVLEHAGRLHHAAQLLLAPPAAHRRRAQRGDELGGLGPHRGGRLVHVGQLGAQLRVRVDPVALEVGDLALIPLEGFVQWRHGSGHGLLRLGRRLERERPHRLLEPGLAGPGRLQGRLQAGHLGGRPGPGQQPPQQDARGQAHHGRYQLRHTLSMGQGCDSARYRGPEVVLGGRIDHRCSGPDGVSRSSRTLARSPCGGMTGSAVRS
jgi:hypothetical protein